MYALVDAVAFYASAEKVFDPSIRHKPVVVLTNNDSQICAISPEARLLGIAKFEPYFKLKGFLRENNVIVRSSNYELYADLSARMMNVIARFCDDQHIYSIDESFLRFSGFERCIKDWQCYGHKIRRAVWRETKLPVGVGFGVTPTLAKAANHAAKKLQGYDGVAVIDDKHSAKQILQMMDVTDVWGIGRRLGKTLNELGISSAWDLAKQSPKHMGRMFSVVVERTVEELNGNTCLSWDEVRQDKQEIFSTRSFGQAVTSQLELKEALVTHCSIVAKKLRAQGSLANKLVVFAHSSDHQGPVFKRGLLYEFSTPSNDTCVFANAVNRVISDIYLPSVKFKKAGVGVIDLVSSQYWQSDLFAQSSDKPDLMAHMDTINSRYGKGTITVASAGKGQRWSMKRDFLSPQYTTRWKDIPRIVC